MHLTFLLLIALIGDCAVVASNHVSFENETQTENVEETTVFEVTTTAAEIITETEEKEVKNKSITHGHSTSYGFLSLPENYNKLAIPLGNASSNEFIVYVKVSIFLRAVLDIDQSKEEVIFDADVNIQWVDWKIYNHLAANNFTHPVTGEKFTNMTLDARALENIWQQDVFIDEMAGTDEKFLLGRLVTLDFLGETDSEDSGDIIYSARKTLKLRCGMDFKYFPADSQTCDYHIRSYSYKDDVLNLSWNTHESKLDRITTYGVYLNDIEDSNFDLQVLSVAPADGNERLFINEKFDKFRAGKYSTLKFTFQARRKLSYHVLQTYVPSVLLILITWVCFILPSSMIEARIGISMTTVLTLTAMFSSVRERSPDVSYVMAIDIWMCFCIFFVFLALLLFTSIYWMKIRLQKRDAEVIKSKTAERKMDILCEQERQEIVSKDSYRRFVVFTKRYAFLAFAVVFVCFVWAYWTWLLVNSNYFDWSPSLCLNNYEQSSADYDKCSEWSTLYIAHSEKTENV